VLKCCCDTQHGQSKVTEEYGATLSVGEDLRVLVDCRLYFLVPNHHVSSSRFTNVGDGSFPCWWGAVQTWARMLPVEASTEHCCLASNGVRDNTCQGTYHYNPIHTKSETRSAPCYHPS